jgi:3'-phosphoadenosine 5'-phosphosulfate (PAPS) 3'-phosphatase
MRYIVSYAHYQHFNNTLQHTTLHCYACLHRWGYRENIWDHVAGAVVIEEAGGKVTDSNGFKLDFSLGAALPPHVSGIVATSG